LLHGSAEAKAGQVQDLYRNYGARFPKSGCKGGGFAAHWPDPHLKAAKLLGRAMPQSLLLRADVVIQ
jgi:hypothetical protein